MARVGLRQWLHKPSLNAEVEVEDPRSAADRHVTIISSNAAADERGRRVPLRAFPPCERPARSACHASETRFLRDWQVVQISSLVLDAGCDRTLDPGPSTVAPSCSVQPTDSGPQTPSVPEGWVIRERRTRKRGPLMRIRPSRVAGKASTRGQASGPGRTLGQVEAQAVLAQAGEPAGSLRPPTDAARQSPVSRLQSPDSILQPPARIRMHPRQVAAVTLIHPVAPPAPRPCPS